MAFGRFFHFFDSAIVLTPVLPRTGIVLCSVGLVWTVVAGWVGSGLGLPKGSTGRLCFNLRYRSDSDCVHGATELMELHND